MPLPIPYALLTFLLAALAAVGPFSIDTYLPAFPRMAEELGASQLQVQQTLTAYMAPFAIMVLWHGTLSDAFGRKRVLLVAMGLYALASLFCAMASAIEWLWVGRALQGICAGAGMVVGRAVVRDLVEGARAQRLMSHVMMVFGIAPAVAPIVGGAMVELAGWRSIFLLLAGFGVALVLLCLRWLPESLPPERRQPMHPVKLARAYRAVFAGPAFMALTGAMALNFAGFFIYVLSAPVFLMEHLGLPPSGFGWFFVPTVAGMMSGSMVSGRMAGRWSQRRSVATGYALMATALAFNLAVSLLREPGLPWSLAFAPAYTFGMALAMPALSLMALDLFPERRGLAASCQGFLQMGINALVAGLLAPRVWHHPAGLAMASALLTAFGAGLFVLWWRRLAAAPQSVSPR
ncbi:MAG: multidrug effflux MFS transporter [Rhodocyclaceae bacterium]|nr:multidrug effflux MFS transporter [Rhodocyclaceae bacterium]